MRIAFYTPMKPLDHPNPSGDQTTAMALAAHLTARGHQVFTPSRLVSRGLVAKPWLWPLALAERIRAAREPFDLWLTCHAYHKAPDLLGPEAARAMGTPYAIFQGSYATRPSRNLFTWPGYRLNKESLLAAEVVFSNGREDLANLRRLLPESRLQYVRPGIDPQPFAFNPETRAQTRANWGVGKTPVVLTAAMFRPGVKEESLAYLIDRLGSLFRQGLDFHLVLAGDGPARGRLEARAAALLPGRALFLGQTPRKDMPALMSGADVFAFPGIGESLGMVYLEAQAAGLPVVAFDNGGVPEVTAGGRSAALTPAFEGRPYETALAALITDKTLRHAMGRAGSAHVRARHDATANFDAVERRLRALAGDLRP